MDDMYRELIIEHYKNPSYRGTLDPCDHSYEDENPSCGDELRIMLNVDENNIITDARFEGHRSRAHGCLSQFMKPRRSKNPC